MGSRGRQAGWAGSKLGAAGRGCTQRTRLARVWPAWAGTKNSSESITRTRALRPQNDSVAWLSTICGGGTAGEWVGGLVPCHDCYMGVHRHARGSDRSGGQRADCPDLPAAPSTRLKLEIFPPLHTRGARRSTRGVMCGYSHNCMRGHTGGPVGTAPVQGAGTASQGPASSP